ncbi:MAG: hypothetical protein WED08_03200 [Patescibacteria group bacterium]
MDRKLIFALFGLVLAGLVSACLPTQVGNGRVPPVTAEPTVVPTEVPPTAVASPTPTAEPAVVLNPAETSEPTDDATPEPTVWEIVETMLAECAGSAEGLPVGFSDEAQKNYTWQLIETVTSKYPGFNSPDWGGVATSSVLADDGTAPNPFSFEDQEDQWPYFGKRNCEGYVLFFEEVPENRDKDGILVGEAYLFYEVGGTEPYVLDGELKEVHFTFPPAP